MADEWCNLFEHTYRVATATLRSKMPSLTEESITDLAVTIAREVAQRMIDPTLVTAEVNVATQTNPIPVMPAPRSRQAELTLLRIRK